MMNSKEFLKYIKNCGINWNEHQKCVLMNFINYVHEIEYWKKELKEKTEYQYLKEFMLLEDYKRIVLDLESYRTRIFYKRLKEKQKKLKEANTSSKDTGIIIKEYAIKQAKSLKLKISIDKQGKILVK